MFNSLASYLWGASSEVENSYTEEVQTAAHADGEHLSTQQDEDWVVVGSGADKSKTSIEHLSCCANPNHPRLSGDPRGCNWGPYAPSTPTVSDSELLDDADSLADSLGLRELSNQFNQEFLAGPSLPDKILASNAGSRCSSDLESEKEEECVRPSSPESVFSACSGRSHATYRVYGNASEPWLMAPAPCFIHDPAAMQSLPEEDRTNVENLLIEHPSMSVYLSPALSSSFPGFTAPATGDEEADDSAEEQRDLEGSTRRVGEGAVARHRPGALHAANHVLNTSPEQLLKKVHQAQVVQHVKSQKAISRQKCERENMVHRGMHHKKGQNRLNKRTRPAGFKASRISQRM